MLTRHRITQRADTDHVDAGVVERDYVLAHIVAQLPVLANARNDRLVLKGGTALRLVHIGDYRYSADLDFTIRDSSPDDAIGLIDGVLDATKREICFPHLQLSDREKPMIEYVGPLNSRPRDIKLDISSDEYVEDVVQLPILRVWDDLPKLGSLNVYSLREITAEKLRCVIQRLQCRDLYDLHQLTTDSGVDLKDVVTLFEEKAHAKQIEPAQFSRRFDERLVQYKRRWTDEMSRHLACDPPDVDEVIRILRRHLRRAGLAT